MIQQIFAVAAERGVINLSNFNHFLVQQTHNF